MPNLTTPPVAAKSTAGRPAIATAATGPTGAETMGAGGPQFRFRADIEGLRAIAVLGVLWFHAGLAGVSAGFAGVDIFFVISGFLITGQLLREVERTGGVSLPRFYARRAKRLFPAAATVLMVSALVTWLTLPKVAWRQIGGDIASAAAYFVNWRLAAQSVDYLAEATSSSPVQHYWSLAVEEQFYIVWPIVLLLLAMLIRARGLPVRPTLAVGLAAITLPSLAWSIYLTSVDPQRAYFVTTTRLWELGVGALVAVGAGVWRTLASRVAAILGWAGLALIGIGMTVQSTGTPWPGSAAAVPVLGAAAVILGGHAAGRLGPVAILGLPPLVWVGGLSYSLYLWHWPLLVAARAVWPGMSVRQSAVVVAASVLPAWVTHRHIENPIRFHPAIARRTRRALALGFACSLIGIGSGSVLAVAGDRSGFERVDLGALPAGTVGGQILGTGTEPARVPIDPHPRGMAPDPLRATEDVPRLYADGCQADLAGSTVVTCTYGDDTSGRVLALVGDSKVAQWFPALERFATSHGWRIRTYLKSGCPWTPALVYGGLDADHRYRACQAWGDRVLDRLTGAERPTVIVTSGIRREAFAPDGSEQLSVMVDGYADYWTRMGRLGVPVVAIMDTPQPDLAAYACVLDHPEDLMTACRGRWNTGSGGLALMRAVDRVSTSRLIDLNPWVCPQEQCWPVIGHVLVWRQSAHLTATYVTSLSPLLERRLTAALTGLGVRDP